jgi:hypothetical protein
MPGPTDIDAGAANARLVPDIPVQGDLWQALTASAESRADILIQPAETVSTGDAAAQVRAALGTDRAGLIVQIPGLIRVADVSLHELVDALLPLTLGFAVNGEKARPELAAAALRQLEPLLAEHAISPPAVGGATPPAVIGRIALDRSFGLAAAATAALSTIKAEAARRLFRINCEKLTWAVLDSGIQADVGAFDCFDESGIRIVGGRITAAYDFSRFGSWLGSISSEGDSDAALVDEIGEAFQRRYGASAEASARKARELIRALRRRLAAGRDLDWEMVQPLVNIPRDRPLPTLDGRTLSHGTAVAGLLAGEILDSSGAPDPTMPQGACPDLRLIDVRLVDVADGALKISEFNLVAALQFLRFLNRRADGMMVHGANLSVSTPHDARNYGCGATLVCEEVDRAVQSGLVVVAAAGNKGYQLLSDGGGGTVAGYFGMTIADPGNAARAITVGSTHRSEPHRYGVSYFSGRGPTGDGRMKPDLLAPGEKLLTLTAHGNVVERQDGTSFAAPLASAAAAMLMAQSPELIGRPDLIKHCLMQTATDLGRDRHAQGAGLVDVLRALQFDWRA